MKTTALVGGSFALPTSARSRSPAFKRNRKRRIIFNDDAYQQRRHLDSIYHVKDKQSFLAARTIPTFDTQVDTYVWCVGNGCEPPWGEWGKKHRAPLCSAIESPERATNWIVEACHNQGLEVWGSLRMNDVHDANVELAETNDPLKAQHPEYLLGPPSDRDLPPERLERLFWSGFNFARSEVRQHRLDFIQRNAMKHDFDGYELDFSRFIWYFRQGREREQAHLMTDFVRKVRAALNRIAKQRGRPYYLTAHVMDTIAASQRIGLDVETWVAEGLVDGLVVGMGGMPFTLSIADWKKLTQRYGVPIYPTFHPRRNFRHDGELDRLTTWQEWLRGLAAWSWQSGVDGLCLFNLFTVADRWRYPKALAYAPLTEVGDQETLRNKNKIYAIEPVVLSGMFSQGSATASLPIALDTHERRLALPMGPDADNRGARFKIYVHSQGGDDKSRVFLRLNHTFLKSVHQEKDLCTVEVDSNLVRAGHNDLRIWSNVELATTSTPIIVREVLIYVRY